MSRLGVIPVPGVDVSASRLPVILLAALLVSMLPVSMLLVCGLLIASPAQGQEIGLMTFAEGEVQHVVRLDDTPWAPCPPSLPEGCEMAVLDGNPQGEDLFTVRFRIPAGALFVMPPHWHPKDERVTVISGTVAVAFGVETTRDDATEFGPGDYYVNARHAVHSVWIDGGTILQITGIGPWEAIPIEQRPPPR